MIVRKKENPQGEGEAKIARNKNISVIHFLNTAPKGAEKRAKEPEKKNRIKGKFTKKKVSPMTAAAKIHRPIGRNPVLKGAGREEEQ